MKITVDPEKCSGCRLCEMVCSLAHHSVINMDRAAIRVLKDDLHTSHHRPLLCRQCRAMKCLEGEAASPTLEKKEFLWHRERAERCPFGALPVLTEEAYHCNLCGGNPLCLKVCTTGALTLTR